MNRSVEIENPEMPLRPRPGFRPISRTNSVVNRDRAPEDHSKNELDVIPLYALIKKNFGIKSSIKNQEKNNEELEENDELVGDTNFEATGVASEFVNVFKDFDEDEMREEGFENTNQYLKAEFNEAPPRRFGSRVKKSTPRWKTEETEFFYNVLSMCGTDFSMMSKFFPNRSRKMIVNKYHIEEEKNKDRVAECISNPRPLDLSLYATTVGIDEGSIVEDYKKNKNKLSQQNLSSSASNASKRRNNALAKQNSNKDIEDEFFDVSDDADIATHSTHHSEAEEGGDDELEGDLDF